MGRQRCTARAVYAQPSRYKRFLLPATVCSCRFEYGDHAGSAGSAQVLSKTDLVSSHLSVAGFAPQLLHQVAQLADAGGAHRMALGLESAARIDWNYAANGRTAGRCKWAAISLRNKA